MTVLNNFKKFLAYCGVLAIAGAFFGLGLWQWDRAQSTRNPVVIDKTLIDLEAVAKPRSALASNALLRSVKVSGKYIAEFKAPRQVDGNKKIDTWQVGLFAPDSGGAILVVRGLWADRIPGQIANTSADEEKPALVLTGLVMPHQSQEYASPSMGSEPGVLTRIDSALIVDATTLDLFDGYIIADSEMVAGQAVVHPWIAPPAPRSAVPGFYWQHISYVITWWLMVAVVLYLPFYRRGGKVLD